MAKRIQGFGGGGGKGGGGGSARVAQEAPDSLRSKAFARVLDLICEGEIEGLVDGAKSIYLDETPVQSSDGSFNFQGVEIASVTGTQSQSYIPGFPAIESENAVGVEMKVGVNVTRQITNPEVDAVRVRISVPSLTSQNTSNGDISGTSVRFAIDRKSDGGTFVQVIENTISGKTTSKYERTFRIPLTGNAPWEIRVRRITADSTQASLQNKTFWESYTEIIEAKLRYPNSALVGIKIDASQFSSIPTRAYDMKLLKVKVPTNYNPVTRAYTGIWNGTFKVEWTDNPAWCFYDLLTNDRYGLGNLIDEAQVDKWAIYSAARYCDELVPNGLGGTEPRFSCNIYIQSRADAYRIIQDMASIFRGMVYWQAGALTVSQDAPSDPVYLYTPANVIDGLFNYQGSSAKTRHTVALVTWNDPEDFYRQKVEYVEDTAGITRYGIIQTELTAIGCTSRGQANRVGRWLLYSEQSESEIVAFKTGMDGVVCRPGQIIGVSDPIRGGTRRGGRIVAATLATVTLDAPVTVTGGGHTLSVILPTGLVETREVASITGVSVTTVTDFSEVPATGAIWILESPNLQSQLFRVVSVVEAEDGIEINALAHNPDKFDVIEDGLVLQPREISVLSIAPAAPTNLIVTESLYESSAEVRVLVSLSWDSVSGATSYLASYKVDEGNYVSLPETASNTVDIRDAKAGRYSFKVQAVNSIGKRSTSAEIVRDIAGKTAPPANVLGFSLVPVAGAAHLTWQKSTDLDVLVGGTIRIRHTPDTTAQEWNNSVDILPAISGNQNSATAPLLAGTYMAKFVDSSGFSSVDPALIITTVPEAVALNAIETITENPAFAGAVNFVRYSDDVDGITLTGADLIDDRTELIDSWEFLDTLGGIATEGTYYFAGDLDLGAVYPSRLTARIRATGYDTGDIWDYRTADIDGWLDIDGSRADTANATLYMRTTNDNPAGTPTWSEWKPFFASQYTARAYEFKIVLTSGNSTHNIAVTDLQVTIDMEDRVLDLQNVVSGAGTYSVTFGEPFRATPSIGITAEAMTSGDYYTISNKTPAGFDIIFKNSAGTAISRTFDVLAKGYGREVTI